jgi:hypothetical protein
MQRRSLFNFGAIPSPLQSGPLSLLYQGGQPKKPTINFGLSKRLKAERMSDPAYVRAQLKREINHYKNEQEKIDRQLGGAENRWGAFAPTSQFNYLSGDLERAGVTFKPGEIPDINKISPKVFERIAEANAQKLPKAEAEAGADAQGEQAPQKTLRDRRNLTAQDSGSRSLINKTDEGMAAYRRNRRGLLSS